MIIFLKLHFYDLVIVIKRQFLLVMIKLNGTTGTNLRVTDLVPVKWDRIDNIARCKSSHAVRPPLLWDVQVLTIWHPQRDISSTYEQIFVFLILISYWKFFSPATPNSCIDFTRFDLLSKTMDRVRQWKKVFLFQLERLNIFVQVTDWT